MQITKKIITLLYCFFIMCFLQAQQKYALIIGINDYYKTPNQQSSSLNGCVNDALSIKAMLEDKFGFENNNIKLLLNQAATKESVIVAFMDILKNCKAGDALVFYFSGHGVWMSNPSQSTIEQVVKRGMNQAIVMSNLFAPNLGCLMANASIKRLFNKAVEKKVILTSIFDCCYSGSMPMSFQIARNSFDFELRGGVEKSLPLSNLVGPAEQISYQDIEEVDKDTALINQLDSNSKAFNLNNEITINDDDIVPRPSEATNSNFCSLSGTNDVEKGIEILDENGLYHGAYTKALLHTIKTNSANITLQKLLKEVDDQMNYQQYQQSPTNNYDPARLTKNIIGISANTFPKQTEAICTRVNKSKIVLNKGLLSGITTGNVFYNKKTNINAKIIQSFLDSSIAIIKNGNVANLTPNEQFILKDDFSTSPPIIKIYIHGDDITAAEFETNFTAIIKPLTTLENYRDYNHFSMLDSTKGLFFNSNKAYAQKSIKSAIASPFIAMLAIPDFITDRLIKQLQTNQNIQLVNSIQEADLELYLHYCNAGKDAEKGKGFVFTFNKFSTNNDRISVRFSSRHVKFTTLPTNNLTINNLINKLEQLVYNTIRAKSNRWLNDYQKR
jgi:hypothetical protein